MSTKFICLRYFFVPLENDLFLNPLSDDTREIMFRERLLINSNYRTRKGKQYAIRITSEKESIVYGKLSISKFEERHILHDDDIENVAVEDWPYVSFCINPNTKKQTMILSIHTDITTKIDRLCSDLSELATAEFIQSGYKISFNPINEKRAFWEIVNHSDYIYSLTLKLNSPNIFGSSSDANESLKELRKVFNNDIATVTLKNEKGKLTLPRENIETFRDYADRGGGTWKLSFKKKKGKRHSYDTAKRALKITLALAVEQLTEEEIMDAANKEFEDKI